MERWFGSLPEGVAELEIDTAHEHYDALVRVQPLLNPAAAPFEIGLRREEFDMWVGYYGFPEIPCAEISPVEYCRSIARDGMVTVEQRLLGRAVNLRTQLHLWRDPDVPVPETWDDFRSCGCALLPLGWLLRLVEEHRVDHPPYY